MYQIFLNLLVYNLNKPINPNWSELEDASESSHYFENW